MNPLQIGVQSGVITLVVGLGFMGVGAFVMKYAFDQRRLRNLMAETPTSDVESLSIGPAEVVGIGRPATEAIPAPFTDEECLAAVWNIEEYKTHTDSKGNRHSSWDTIASGTDHVPFYVDDGTGELLVRPDDRVTFDVGDELTIRAGRGQAPPAPIYEFKAYKGDDENGRFFGVDLWDSVNTGSTWRKRRYTQHLIRPGEKLYVFGTVQLKEGARSADNPENLVIQRVPKGDEDLEPMFLVSNRPEKELRKSRRWSLALFPVGALLATAGLAVLLFGLGIA